MNKLVVLVGLVLLSGCASSQRVDGLTQSVRAQEVAHERFVGSTIEAERNTVRRVNQLESQVRELFARVCELEKRKRTEVTDTSDLDRKFKKYMSK